jgi:hypothetical protein
MQPGLPSAQACSDQGQAAGVQGPQRWRAADRVAAMERGAVFHTGPDEPLLTDLEYRKKVLWL